MPLHILHLPEEVLDPIVGLLLPEYDRNGLLQHIHIPEYERPDDLLRCRSVCRSLFRVASRWLHRRIHMQWFLHNHHVRINVAPFTIPEYAANTRMLRITASIGSGSQAVLPFPSPSKRTLLSRMSNLQILIVQLCPTIVTEILPGLLSLPLLHTVILEASETLVVSSDWASIGGPFPNIRNLGFRRVRDIGPLISLSPHVEALSFTPSSRLDDTLSCITFPWHTLRQLTLQHVLEFKKTCAALMHSYQSLDHNIHTSLTELLVAQNLTYADAHHLLTTFDGHPLRSLLIGCVVNLDIPFLERVVSTFPHLREFALLKTGGDSPLSTTQLNQYATVLGRLPSLKALHLNCIRHRDNDLSLLRFQFDEILGSIVPHCPILERLRFMHQGDGISTIASIVRDRRGEYKGYHLESRQDRCCLSTSAWHLGGTSFT